MQYLSWLVTGLFVLFHLSSVAMDTNAQPTSIYFSAETINNPEELHKAQEFCTRNARNVVMIIDDGSTIRFTLRRFMHKEGYVTFEFENGDDYLLALRHQPLAKVLVPNSRLAILDNHMPGETLGVDILDIVSNEGLLKYGNNGEREVPLALHTSDELSSIKTKVKHFVRKMSMPDLFRIMDANNSPPPFRPRSQTH